MHAHIIVDGRVERTSSVDAIRAAHTADRTMWVELGEPSPEAEQLLTETFGVHPLLVEDIFGESSVPKIEELGGYLYIVVHALGRNDDPTRAEMGVLDIVIGHTFVLTQHREGPATERLRERLDRSPELLRKGAAWLGHAFIDMVIDRFPPFMEALRTRIDAAEVRVMSAADGERDLLPELTELKRSVLSLCRIAHHQRDILRQLSRTEYPQIPVAARPYFRDVYDHFMRVAEDAETYKDVATGAVDAYLNVQSYRMNDTVKRLTLISTVMLPLNLIASFYGMNFASLPGLGYRWGFVVVLGVMAAVTVGVWTYFKIRRWAYSPRDVWPGRPPRPADRARCSAGIIAPCARLDSRLCAASSTRRRARAPRS
jgi:magnesium transporter